MYGLPRMAPHIVALVALVAWALGVTNSALALGLLLVLVGGFSPQMFFRSENGKFEWTGTDWFWSIIALLVIVAMFEGVSPVVLLEKIKSLKPS
jgi:uncharacterized membrane protein